MGTVAKDNGGSDFKPVPAGTHAAVCTMVVDMGVQPSAKFKPRQKIYLRWEIPAEQVTWKDADGVEHTGPAVVGKQYTLSLSEKAHLRADLESWRGRTFTEQELVGFDVKNVLGAPCMLGVTHNKSGEKTYANVSAVMGLPKGMPKPIASGALIHYDIDAHNQAVFEKLPGWLQTAIKDRVANESDSVPASNGTDKEFDDEIPF